MYLFKKIFNSSLVRSSGTYTISTVVNSAIPFLLLPVLTRYLSPKDYGIIAMFHVCLSIMTIFIGLNLHGAIGREYIEKEEIDYPNFITNCLYILVISSITNGLLIYLFSHQLSTVTNFPSDWFWAIWVVSFCQSIILILLTLFQMQTMALAYGLIQICLTICNVGLTIWFVVLLRMNWQGRIQGAVIANIIFFVIGIYILIKKNWIKKGVNKIFIKKALSFSLPLVPHALGGWTISITDRVLITNLAGLDSTGVYVVGAQIGMLILIIQDAFNRAWVPWLFERLKKNDHQQKITIVKITYFYNAVLIILALLIAIISPWLLSFLVGKNFITATDYILWIAIGYAFNGMYKMVANYIFYAKKTHILAWLTFFTAISNIIISYLLIIKNGPVGAAQGTMFAFFMTFLLTWILSAKVYDMPWFFILKIRD
jgi:O-antigen/teichoic acid export membrane protein